MEPTLTSDLWQFSCLGPAVMGMHRVQLEHLFIGKLWAYRMSKMGRDPPVICELTARKLRPEHRDPSVAGVSSQCLSAQTTGHTGTPQLTLGAVVALLDRSDVAVGARPSRGPV